MTYNGIELVEMPGKNWDGKPRKMLVWDDTSKRPREEMVVGYTPCYNQWITNCRLCWKHCAEIPKKESTQSQCVDEMISVLLAYKVGKKIECRFRDRTKRDSWSCIKQPDWNWAIFEYRVKNEE